MNNTWMVKDVHFSFRLGVRHIHGISITTLMLDCGLAYNQEMPISIELPESKLTDDINAVYIRSLPTNNQDIELISPEPMIRYSPWKYQKHHIELSRDFDQYLSRLSANTRKNGKRNIRRFTDFSGGEIKWREYRCEEIAEFYMIACELSKITYQEKLLGEGLPKDNDFENEMMKLASEDKVRGYILFHNDRAIAYDYYQNSQDTLHLLFGGYDQEYAQWSPGNVLFFLEVKKFFKDQTFKTLDLGEGDFKYKKDFATNTSTYSDVFFFKKTLKNKALIKSYSQWNALVRTGNLFAEKLKIKSMLKKMNKTICVAQTFPILDDIFG